MGTQHDIARLLDERFELICGAMVEGFTIGRMLKIVLPEFSLSSAKLGYYRWKRKLDPAREAELFQCSKEGAESIEEQAGEVIDNAESDRDELQRARFKSGYLQWRAGTKDPSRYSKQAQQSVNVQVDLGEVFSKALDAARERAIGPAAEVRRISSGDVVDAEVIGVEPESVEDLL